MRRLLAPTVSWAVILSALGLLAVMVAVPRAAGATPYTVLTGSMEPSYPPGTLVVAKPIATEAIGVGTPITYQLESGERAVVTHRVVAVQQGADGTRSFVTRGDANDAADESPVRPVQVRGAVWYAVPYLGYLNTWLDGPRHRIVVFLVVAALLAYAAYMFTSAGLDRVRRRNRATGHRTAGDPT